MPAFSDVRKMVIARQVEYQDVSEMTIVKLECYRKIMADDLFSSIFN